MKVSKALNIALIHLNRRCVLVTAARGALLSVAAQVDLQLPAPSAVFLQDAGWAPHNVSGLSVTIKVS